jgi:hypothetical protein
MLGSPTGHAVDLAVQELVLRVAGFLEGEIIGEAVPVQGGRRCHEIEDITPDGGRPLD